LEHSIRYEPAILRDGFFVGKGNGPAEVLKAVLRKIWECGFGFCSIGFPLNLKELD
jgi:hypothetical protein